MNYTSWHHLAGISILVCALFWPESSRATMDPRFEIDISQIAPKSAAAIDSHSKQIASSEKRGKTRKKYKSIPRQASAAFRLTAPKTVQHFDAGKLRMAWEKISSDTTHSAKAISFQSDMFSLTLDPVHYPQLPAFDGGRILLDLNGTLPPLVQTLIYDRAPDIRIINAVNKGNKAVLGEVLRSAGFYSLEEQTILEFGSDPKVSIRADFKIERTADSVMKNDLLLINADTGTMPNAMATFLKKRGITLLEPFAETPFEGFSVKRHRLIQTSSVPQSQAVDLLLETMGLTAQRNLRLSLFNAAETGIALAVPAEIMFERNGQKYVVNRFSGDPIAYTLLRLLETRGYRVITLDARDSAQTVLTKVLGKMGQASVHTQQKVLGDSSGRYSVEMSGILLENATADGGAVMFTDRSVEPGLKAIFVDHGFTVQER